MAKPQTHRVAADTAPQGLCGKSLRLARAAMEAVVLLLVCLSPWAFGAVDPFWEFLLLLGVGVVLVLWAAVLLLEGRLSWRKCPVVLCLAALYLLGMAQVTPLPRQVLAAVSPTAARMYGELLPAQPEVLPDGAARSFPATRPGSTLSLYPGATQRELVRLLAVFLLFAAVRNNIATPAAFRRLAIAATVNGAALSLFALLQFFGAPRQTVYWSLHTDAEVFGPFICRNHFPFYVNVCLGLGAGLLLSLRASADDHSLGRAGWAGSLTAALHDPRRLWVGIALVLMLAAVAVSLSRGGFIALVGGAVLFLVLRFWRSPRFSQLAASVLVAGAAVALLAWFGAERVQARLATVLDGQGAGAERVPLWSRLLPTAAEYPVFGSGYGTFDFLEPLTRTTGEDAGWRYEHAHNDYLEALLEGGLVRLGLTLSAIGLVYWFGVRAFVREADGPGGAGAGGAVRLHRRRHPQLRRFRPAHPGDRRSRHGRVWQAVWGGGPSHGPLAALAKKGERRGGACRYGSVDLPLPGACPVRWGGGRRRTGGRSGRGGMAGREGRGISGGGLAASNGGRPRVTGARPRLSGGGGGPGARVRRPAPAAG